MTLNEIKTIWHWEDVTGENDWDLGRVYSIFRSLWWE